MTSSAINSVIILSPLLILNLSLPPHHEYDYCIILSPCSIHVHRLLFFLRSSMPPRIYRGFVSCMQPLSTPLIIIYADDNNNNHATPTSLFSCIDCRIVFSLHWCTLPLPSLIYFMFRRGVKIMMISFVRVGDDDMTLRSIIMHQ